MQISMTKGSIWKSILLFTLPILGGMLLQQLYSTVDGIIVGNFVSGEALGSIGTCGPLISLLLAVATGFASGFGVVAAQFFGADRENELRSSWGTAFSLTVISGLVITVLGLLVGRPFLKYVLSVPDSVLDMSVTYLKIYCVGMVFQFVYNAQSSALRALGDSTATTVFLLISTVVNILLDLLFVVVFRWGVAGAAVATVIAQAASVIAALIYTEKKYPMLHLDRAVLLPRREETALICRYGLPTAFQTAALALGALVLQRLVNSFGAVLLEGYTAGARVESFITLPIISFNIGIATFTGQNIGAGEHGRVKKGLWQTMGMMALSTCTIAALVIIFWKPLISLFGCSGQALEYGGIYLRFLASWLIVFGVLFVVKGMLSGAGDVTAAMVITMFSMVVRIVMAYVMAAIPSIGFRAIWYSTALDFVVGVILMFIRYFSGAWKKKAVVSAEAPEEA